MSDNLKGKDRLAYTRKLFRDADSFRTPDRIPLYTHSSLWHFLDAGFTSDEACRSYDKMMKSQLEHIDKYDPDMIIKCNRNPFPIKDQFGASSAYLETKGGLNAINEAFLLPEDYEEIAKGNYHKVVWEHAVFRKFDQADQISPEEYARRSLTLREWDENMAKISDAVYARGVVEVTDTKYFCVLFFETLFNSFRGIKSMAMDLRRCPDQIDEACEYMDALTFDPIIEDFKTNDYPEGTGYVFDAFSNLLGHVILNRKQFERYMAKPYKKLLDVVEEKGLTWYNFSESSWKRFGDFFNQYKKGTVAMQVESDDIYDMRECFPNIALWGGLPVDVLGNGTPEECVDAAKKAVETLGQDGGFVLMPNKMLSYTYDCKPENLAAVSAYVHGRSAE